MAEGARLESVYTATYRGFESPPHRHIRDESSYESTGFFLLYSPLGGMRTPDRGSTTGAASWTDRERSKRAAPQGRAKRVNPPLTAIFEMRARTKVRAFFASDPGKPPRGRHKCLARATHPTGCTTTSSPAKRSAAGNPTGRTTSSPSRRSAAGEMLQKQQSPGHPGLCTLTSV